MNWINKLAIFGIVMLGTFEVYGEGPLAKKYLKEGFSQATDSIAPSYALNWLSLALWWKAPPLEFCVDGYRIVRDLLDQEKAKDKDFNEHVAAYVTGYSIGNALRVLLYAAPALVQDIHNLYALTYAPFDVSEHEFNARSKRFKAVVSTLFLPLIVSFMKSGYSVIMAS